MALDKTKFTELLQKAGLNDYVEAILQYAKPCIRLHASRAADPGSLPLGGTRIGGLPDLPSGVTWLTRNGRPCEFIAQINLSEASQYDETDLLPKEGVLLFFYDGRDYEDEVYQPYQMGSEIIIYYTGDTAALERATDLPALLSDWQSYRACSVEVEADWMLPDSWNFAMTVIKREVFQQTTVDDPQSLAETYEQMANDLLPKKYRDKHHLLGYSAPTIQDDPLYHVPNAWDGRKMDEDVMSEWMLLLQISSDHESGMLWGDTSSLYYCIRKDDLIARRFGNAICIEQNH